VRALIKSYVGSELLNYTCWFVEI